MDWVKIVTCKDCKNNFLGDCPIKSAYEGGYFKYTNCDSDYCSYGERKEEPPSKSCYELERGL